MRNKLQLPVTYALVFIAASLVITTGCAKSKVVASLEKDTLFSLKLGNFEDQINLFDLASVGEINTAIEMKDGFFYIANGESKKIMETNSYGDLLSLYYNADTNPTPSFMQDKTKTAGSTQNTNLFLLSARRYTTTCVVLHRLLHLVRQQEINRTKRKCCVWSQPIYLLIINLAKI